jgi:drug/metabolite transporter (DMT)-like permease
VAAAVLLASIRIGRGGTRQPWLKWSLLLLLGVVLYVFVAYLYALHHQR